MPGIWDLLNGTSTDPDSAAVRQGLLATGLGLLASKGNVSQALGQAGQQGLGAYNDAQDSAQARALKKLQIERDQAAMTERARQQTFLQNLQSPQAQAAQTALAGGGGPTNANAQRMEPVDPPNQLMFEAVRNGMLPISSYIDATRKNTAPIKLGEGESLLDPKSYKPLAMGTPKAESLPEVSKLIAQMNRLPPGDPMRATYLQAIQKATTHQPAVNIATYGSPVPVELPGGGIGYAQPGNREGAPPQIMRAPGGQPLTKPADPNAPNKVAEAKEAIALIDQAGPILDKATGSLYGQGKDIAAAAFGQPTTGSLAATQLDALSAALVAKMPKMSGPQSDKDVENYKKAAGDIANRSVPVANRKEALKTIREIQMRYAGMPVATAPAASAPNVRSAADAILNGGR